MTETGAVLLIVVLAAFQPATTTDGFARRTLEKPTVTAIQHPTLAGCEFNAQRWLDDIEEFPLPGRTVRVFCVVP